MDAITYTAVRANLARTMDRVCNDHEALIITRNGEQSVVMLSLEDFKSLEETACQAKLISRSRPGKTATSIGSSKTSRSR